MKILENPEKSQLKKALLLNLSPYEKDRIIPNSFGLTEMGRDLLGEDYMLKQITASLIYPDDQVGKRFWKRIYEEAAKRYGTTNISVNTFNKVWIVPEKAVVYENAKAGTAYVIESRLKVMLEEDYLSLAKHEGIQSSHALNKDTNSLGSQIVREIVIPELTKEVNENKNFARLRQVYNSLILATWYKKKIKDSILSQVYSNKNKVAGVNIDDPKEKEKIYQRYLRAFKKGVYNYIKEDIDPVTQETVPRKYFSGGVTAVELGNNLAMTSSLPKGFLSSIHSSALILLTAGVLMFGQVLAQTVGEKNSSAFVNTTHQAPMTSTVHASNDYAMLNNAETQYTMGQMLETLVAYSRNPRFFETLVKQRMIPVNDNDERAVIEMLHEIAKLSKGDKEEIIKRLSKLDYSPGNLEGIVKKINDTWGEEHIVRAKTPAKMKAFIVKDLTFFILVDAYSTYLGFNMPKFYFPSVQYVRFIILFSAYVGLNYTLFKLIYYFGEHSSSKYFYRSDMLKKVYEFLGEGQKRKIYVAKGKSIDALAKEEIFAWLKTSGKEKFVTRNDYKKVADAMFNYIKIVPGETRDSVDLILDIDAAMIALRDMRTDKAMKVNVAISVAKYWGRLVPNKFKKKEGANPIYNRAPALASRLISRFNPNWDKTQWENGLVALIIDVGSGNQVSSKLEARIKRLLGDPYVEIFRKDKKQFLEFLRSVQRLHGVAPALTITLLNSGRSQGDIIVIASLLADDSLSDEDRTFLLRMGNRDINQLSRLAWAIGNLNKSAVMEVVRKANTQDADIFKAVDDYKSYPKTTVALLNHNNYTLQQNIKTIVTSLHLGKWLSGNENIQDEKAVILAEREIPLEQYGRYMGLEKYFGSEKTIEIIKNAPQIATKNGWTTRFDPANRWFSTLSAQDLVLVHRTKFPPEGGVIKTTRSATGLPGVRDTVHFTFNHPVMNHMEGADWDKMPYTIIIPAYMFPKGKIKNMMAADTWLEGDVDLPEGAVVLGFKGTPVPKNIGKAIYREIGASDEDLEQAIKDLGYIVTQAGKDHFEDFRIQSLFREFLANEGFKLGTLHQNTWHYAYEQTMQFPPDEIIIHAINGVVNWELTKSASPLEDINSSIGRHLRSLQILIERTDISLKAKIEIAAHVRDFLNLGGMSSEGIVSVNDGTVDFGAIREDELTRGLFQQWVNQHNLNTNPMAIQEAVVAFNKKWQSATGKTWNIKIDDNEVQHVQEWLNTNYGNKAMFTQDEFQDLSSDFAQIVSSSVGNFTQVRIKDSAMFSFQRFVDMFLPKEPQNSNNDNDAPILLKFLRALYMELFGEYIFISNSVGAFTGFKIPLVYDWELEYILREVTGHEGKGMSLRCKVGLISDIMMNANSADLRRKAFIQLERINGLDELFKNERDYYQAISFIGDHLDEFQEISERARAILATTKSFRSVINGFLRSYGFYDTSSNGRKISFREKYDRKMYIAEIYRLIYEFARIPQKDVELLGKESMDPRLSQKFNIFRPFFWPDKIRKSILENRELNETSSKQSLFDSPKGVAIVIYPKSDHNLAFMDHNNIKDIINEGYSVLYYEVDSGYRMLEAIDNATSNGRYKASFLLIGGHGTSESITFSKYHQLGKISPHDITLGPGALKKYFKDDARAILESCSTGGAVKSAQFNMVDAFTRAGILTVGPDSRSSLRKINFERIENSKYSRRARTIKGGEKSDLAMFNTQTKNGGIDLTPANMNLQTRNAGEAIKFHIDPAMLEQLKNAPGFVPVIINIQPLKNLSAFLGINTTNALPVSS